MKKIPLLVLMLALLLTACSGTESSCGDVLHVFAASSMTETLDQIINLYQDAAPDVTIIPTYDSSGTLLTQIQEGADCDLFLSAAPKQMNTLEEAGFLLEDTRLNLLENRVTLAVPEGNPKGVTSFDHLAELLESGDVLLAIGNSDVPVGQYTQKIFLYYGLTEAVLADSGVLTYGSNVKEVTAQVSEGSVDCGIIYATDALSAGLSTADKATAEMCGQIICPAAVLRSCVYPERARAFLDFLTSSEAGAVFERAGFTPLNK